MKLIHLGNSSHLLAGQRCQWILNDRTYSSFFSFYSYEKFFMMSEHWLRRNCPDPLLLSEKSLKWCEIVYKVYNFLTLISILCSNSPWKPKVRRNSSNSCLWCNKLRMTWNGSTILGCRKMLPSYE